MLQPQGPESLRNFVPDKAVLALVLRKGAFTSLLQLLEEEPAMKGELSEYLKRALGADLTRIQGVMAFSTNLGPAPTFAALFRVPGTRSLKLPRAGAHAGVPLYRLDKDVVAAALPQGLVLGAEREVKMEIAVLLGKAPALRPNSPLGTLLGGDPQSVDLEVGAAVAGMADPQLQATAERFGVRLASLVYDSRESADSSGQVTLTLSGDAARMALAREVLRQVMKSALLELEKKKDEAKKGTDIAMAAGQIAGYHYAQRLARELEPRLENDQLLVRYRIPRLAGGSLLVGVVGVLAAVAIPAFTSYVRKAKAAEPALAPPAHGF